MFACPKLQPHWRWHWNLMLRGNYALWGELWGEYLTLSFVWREKACWDRLFMDLWLMANGLSVLTEWLGQESWGRSVHMDQWVWAYPVQLFVLMLIPTKKHSSQRCQYTSRWEWWPFLMEATQLFRSIYPMLTQWTLKRVVMVTVIEGVHKPQNVDSLSPRLIQMSELSL